MVRRSRDDSLCPQRESVKKGAAASICSAEEVSFPPFPGMELRNPQGLLKRLPLAIVGASEIQASPSLPRGSITSLEGIVLAGCS